MSQMFDAAAMRQTIDQLPEPQGLRHLRIQALAYLVDQIGQDPQWDAVCAQAHQEAQHYRSHAQPNTLATRVIQRQLAPSGSALLTLDQAMAALPLDPSSYWGHRDMRQAMNTVFSSQTIVYRLTKDHPVGQPLPLTMWQEPSSIIHTAIVWLEAGAQADITESCQGTKRPGGEVRAPAYHYRLQPGSNLKLTAFQHWTQDMQHMASRSFEVDATATCRFVDIHLAPSGCPTTHQIRGCIDLTTLIVDPRPVTLDYGDHYDATTKSHMIQVVKHHPIQDKDIRCPGIKTATILDVHQIGGTRVQASQDYLADKGLPPEVVRSLIVEDALTGFAQQAQLPPDVTLDLMVYQTGQ